jgi:hypothetical protein
LGKRSQLDPPEPPNRYERARPDCARLAYVEVLTDEKSRHRRRFPAPRDRHYQRHGITAERVMTDNSSGYRTMIEGWALRRDLRIKHTTHRSP